VLLVIGAVLAVVGARGKWAGVFWPGLAVVVVLVVTQLVDAAAEIPTWITLALVGVVLVVAGARWEWVRLRGRRTRQWAGALR
jgi:MFS superfamily sulfate permease-like transporter